LSTDYVVAPAAIDDIDEIATWMLEKDPDSDLDLRFVDTAYETFEFLARQPGAGHKRQDLTSLPVLFCRVMKPFTSFRGGLPRRAAGRNRPRNSLGKGSSDPSRGRRELGCGFRRSRPCLPM
jgi:plasmid stabilization system protein ParE